MHYNEIKQGYFIARPNRFIAHIELDGQVEVCHVKNTGRCRELLTPRAVVYVECHHDPRRKTKYSLIAVRKGSLLINMDSQAPNKVVAEWLASGELLPGFSRCFRGNNPQDGWRWRDRGKLRFWQYHVVQQCLL